MNKFGRNYVLEIDTDDGLLTIKPPLTIEFDVQRHTLTSANVCKVRVYNLSEKNRNLVRHNANDYGNFRLLSLRAGYGDNMPQIFTGNITSAWSTREGTNFITEMECFDGGFAINNGQTNVTFPSGTPTASLIRTLMASLPRVTPGVIGDYTGVLRRAASYSGNTVEILKEITGGGFFIDGGKGNALGTNEYILAPLIPTVNATSGLLGTPRLEQTTARFEMLFEPILQPGIMVNLVSRTSKNFNGAYKLNAVFHRGMISEAVSGAVVTTAEFFYSKELTGVLPA